MGLNDCIDMAYNGYDLNLSILTAIAADVQGHRPFILIYRYQR